MRDENELRNGLRELADDYQVPDGLQDRVARRMAARRLRNRSLGALAATAASVALVAAVAIGAGNDDAGRRISTDRTTPHRTTTSVERAPTSSTTLDTATSTSQPAPAATTVAPTIPLPTTTSVPQATITTTTHPEEPPERCPVTATLPPGDVDGDGIDDVLWHGWVDRDGTFGSYTSTSEEMAVGVCLSRSGRFDSLIVRHTENTQAFDLDGDGTIELLPSGTSVSTGWYEIVTFDQGQLRLVTEGAGQVVVLVDGGTTFDREGQPLALQLFGCLDAGDGSRNLARVSIEAQETSVRWTRVISRLRGSTLEHVDRTTGEAAVGSDLWTVARRLAPEC